MVESESTSSIEPFQFLKNIDVVPFSEVRAAQHNLCKSNDLDIHVLASVAQKLERLCAQKKLSALHAVFCGLQIPLFVVFDDQGFFRYFYRASYSGKSEIKKFIESSFYNSKSNYENVYFLSERYDDILFTATEILVGSCIQAQEINENFCGAVAVLVQHMVDIEQGKFLFVNALEVVK